MKTTNEKLNSLAACSEAIEWAGDKTIQEIWNTCHRGDWMLWLFRRTNPEDKRELTRAKAHCANTVRHLMKDVRSTHAVDVAIRYGEGNATDEELKTAAAAAAAAAARDAFTADASASAAAYASAYAAAAASASASAAYAYASAYASAASADSASAAYAYASAYASAASADSARAENRLLTADICRKYLPVPTF